uniref:SEA domain-containing protein n=1 Tax=Elaeophora elaphi TaxID=1147741 RepID=A0A0R3S5H8_9BILA
LLNCKKYEEKNFTGERTAAEQSQTAKNSFKESAESKDISVIDDTFYHTDVEGVAATFKPTTINERKLKSELVPRSEPAPEPEPFPGSRVLETSKGNHQPDNHFEPKSEPEFTFVSGDSKGSKNDLNGILYIDRTHITNSHNAKEGAYKTPFSFRITSIDYIPEFGDPNSGKYKKLQDQLLPDLEEIFGSIFGHIYNGIHLVSFLKGSVIVDGIVYTSAKPDDMEQSATEFEQQITAKNSQIGGNNVDPRSIVLDGAIIFLLIKKSF